MSRFIQPPKDQLHKLRRPLTNGEMKVFQFFDKHLHQSWEIYIEPHLNGLRPDFVLLHPKAGIAVFEIKDWNLDTLKIRFEYLKDHEPTLVGEKNGKIFPLPNPIDKIFQYKEEIFDLYCPRLEKQLGFAVISAGVIFPFADHKQVMSIFSKYYENRIPKNYWKYHPLSGRENLEKGDIFSVFPQGERGSSKYMNPVLANDLRNWLVEPDFAAIQRKPLELDSHQVKYVTTRTKKGYRRIKGPAGSGKSMVLAARAAQLASEGKEVLVITYNITLLHYLMDLAVRWDVPNGRTRQNITWLNFHHWCKRTYQQMDCIREYRQFWAKYFENEEETKEQSKKEDNADKVLNEDLPEFVGSLIDSDVSQMIPRYDAIIIDEGQDFLPEWWNILRKVIKPGGEMLLAADTTQDVYGRSRSWTDKSMLGAGFEGPWIRFSISYRMPPILIEHVCNFSKRFLPKDISDEPEAQKELDFYPCQLKWVQTKKDNAIQTCVNSILEMPVIADPDLIAIPDVTFICDNTKFGLEVVKEIGKKGIKTIHTFSEDSKHGRKLKLGFFMGDARVKATTHHSFKGWESRAIVLYTGYAGNVKARCLIYSGITRLKRHMEGSYLTVVCSADKLAIYGQSWPDFHDLTSRDILSAH